MKLILSIVAFVLGTAVSAFAGAPYCGYSYAKPYVAPYVAPVYQPPHVTVNLVGIPVPVAYEKPIALQGSTYYSYSHAAAYAPLDLALVFDRAGRLAENAQTLQAEATSAYLQLATSARNDKREESNIRAAAQGIAQVLRESRSTETTETTGVLRLNAPASATGVLKASCVKCHEKFSDWESLDYDTQKLIFSRVNHADPSKRMPRTGDGKDAGEPLGDESKLLLFPQK